MTNKNTNEWFGLCDTEFSVSELAVQKRIKAWLVSQKLETAAGRRVNNLGHLLLAQGISLRLESRSLRVRCGKR